MNDSSLYQEIKQILNKVRAKVYRSANFAMVTSYWEIGKRIVEFEQHGETRAEYGKSVLRNLSQQLTQDFGKGFDERNLRYIREFYLNFPIWNALHAELTWTHYRLLLKVENEKARQYYINECIEQNWSTRSLERQINYFYYERILSSQNKNLIRDAAASNHLFASKYSLYLPTEEELKQELESELLQLTLKNQGTE